MKRIGLQVVFFVVLALVLTYWLGMSPQEVIAEPDVHVPFLEQWAGSGHADSEAEAFRHWDEDEEKVVPESCAKCHSTPGYLDFLGADGSEAGKVDQAVPVDVNTGIECVACHNDVTMKKTSVVMPSGVEIPDWATNPGVWNAIRDAPPKFQWTELLKKPVLTLIRSAKI